MSIIKSKHASNFTVLPNEIFNCNLSLEAIGLLANLLKLPSDWVIQKSYLPNQFNIGREKIDRMFKELQDAGFIISLKEYDDQGRFSYNHIVYDRPFNGEPNTVKPITAEPHTAKPSTVNQQLLNKDKLNKDILNTDIQNKENKISCFSFSDFWNMYPVKNQKQDVIKKYEKLTESQRAEIRATLPKFLEHKPFAKYKHPNPLTYINQKRWEDVIEIEKEEKIIKWD